MPAKNLICVVIEGLHAGMVGAYGNSWIRTAALDALACESFLFDQAYLESPLLERTYRAFWHGLHAADCHVLDEDAESFPHLLAAGGLHSALLTDSAEVAGLLPAAEFVEQLLIESQEDPSSAQDIAETGLARLFGAATEWLRAPREPFCLWIHARGMAAPWDAPLELRDRFADEEDPEPPRVVEVPNHWLPNDFDPDEPLGIKHAYAGQVALLDLCLGGLLDEFDASPLAATTQLTFLSTAGFPLGEHRRIGSCDDALYNERTQLVWMMRFPDEMGRLARSQALVQPTDLPVSLLEWLEIDRGRLAGTNASSLIPLVRGEVDSLRDRLLMVGPHDRAMRTSAWHLRQPLTGAAELYSKPSDRWEVSEVANLLPDIVLGMQAALEEIVVTGPVTGVPPLDEALTSELD